MTYFAAWEDFPGLAAALSAAEDRATLMGPYTQRNVMVAPGLEIKTNVLDPSGGANYTGGSSYEPEIPLLASEAGLAGLSSLGMFAADPLKCLGAFPVGLCGFDAVEKNATPEPEAVRTRDFARILAISTEPGTPVSGALARHLAEKSLKLADLADKRAEVTNKARQGYRKAIAETDRLDVLTDRALKANDLKKAAIYRKEALEKGREAVRYQKVNALATGMTENAAAQAEFTQQMADAVLAGRPDVVAVLGVAYDKLGAETEKMREIRKEQVAKAQTADLNGLGFFGVHGFVRLDNVFEGELNEIELDEFGMFDEGLGDLGRVRGRIRRKIKRKIKNKVLKPIGQVAKKAGQAIGKVAAKLTVGLPCKLMQSKMVKGVVKGAATAVGSFYGGPVGGAVGSRAADRAAKIDSTVCGALKKVGLDGSSKFKPGAIKGALKGAAKTIVKDSLNPKEALKTLTAVGTAYVGGAAAGKVMTAAGGSIAKTVAKQAGKQVLNTVQRKIPGLNKVPVAGALTAYASGGGGDLLKFGASAIKNVGLSPAVQQAYMKRMSQVALQQVAQRGQLAMRNAIGNQASNLVAGALRR